MKLQRLDILLGDILGQTFKATGGTLSSLTGMKNNASMYQFTAPIQAGNSGGPLLDRSGNVVGIITSSMNAIWMAQEIGSLPQNVNFAIKDAIAKTFLDISNINYKTSPSKERIDRADIIDNASGFVVRVECAK